MRQVKLQNKLNKVSPKPEEKTIKDSPRIVSKLTRYEKFVPNEKAPEKMKTRPASTLPTKDLPSKLNAAIRKIEELKYKAPTATVLKPKVSPKKDTMKEMYEASKIKNNNVPMGSGSKSKPSSSSGSFYKNRK